ncbi:hypothetical protein AVEN_16287-1 [Araneus ventricosus]|uniref:Uncharacterized protein n=1 Tax=Araneus ventricosus TaxID=182803 RepID=A0A4Y2PB84_ARAVE|nr:hypothetical protein AVEN_16287-1 [Araneus ventricosus]
MELVVSNRDQMTRTTPELAPSSPNFRTTPAGGRLNHVRFRGLQTKLAMSDSNTADFQWNLESSGCEAEILPLGHRAMVEMENILLTFSSSLHVSFRKLLN